VEANNKMAEVTWMLKAIHAQEDRQEAQKKATEVMGRLREMKLHKAAHLIEQKIVETFTYYAYPSVHWRQIRTNNLIERINREIRRRTRVVGAFPDENSALMLVTARLRHIAASNWGRRCYLNMDALLKPATGASGSSLRIRSSHGQNECAKHCGRVEPRRATHAAPILRVGAIAAALFIAASAAASPPATDPGEWRLLGLNAEQQHFSPLTQINDKNVQTLGLAWAVDIPSADGLVGVPLVARGTV